jgi:hypothetical protein
VKTVTQVERSDLTSVLLSALAETALEMVNDRCCTLFPTVCHNVHSCPCPGEWWASHADHSSAEERAVSALTVSVPGVALDAVRKEKFVFFAGSRTTIYFGRSQEECPSCYSVWPPPLHLPVVSAEFETTSISTLADGNLLQVDRNGL